MPMNEKDLLALICKFLDESNYKDTIHELEKESSFYFDVKYLEKCIKEGEWDKAENYLSGFTKIDDEETSMKIFFFIRHQNYMEALHKGDSAKAVKILQNDLQYFESSYPVIYTDMTLLLSEKNIRENGVLYWYSDIKIGRAVLFEELEKLVSKSSFIKDKLYLPNLGEKRLQEIISQSRHVQPNGCDLSSSSSSSRMRYGSHDIRSSYSLEAVPNQPRATILALETISQRPRIPVAPQNNFGAEYVSRWPVRPQKIPNFEEEIPKTVLAYLVHDSTVTNLDFHPFQHSLLLVGMINGDIVMWDAINNERLASRNFMVSNMGVCSEFLQASLSNEYNALPSVTRVLWNQKGDFFGVAFSKHIVKVYSHHGGGDIRNHLEINAHVGSVNDLAFCSPNDQLCIMTCGDDKLIKVWSSITGTQQYMFEGHEAPIYSVCPYTKGGFKIFLSTSIDGKIRSWKYENGAIGDHVTPSGLCWTKLTYNVDHQRLFSCGTGSDFKSRIHEIDDDSGEIKRTYFGLSDQSSGIVQFDITNNKYLVVAGDGNAIKFWDIDNEQLLTTIDTEGVLQDIPCIRFNKDGTLLAVSTKYNNIKILGNASRVQAHCLQRSHNSTIASGSFSEGRMKSSFGASSSKG